MTGQAAGPARDGTALAAAALCAAVALGAVGLAVGQAADARAFLGRAAAAEGVVTATPHGGYHPDIRFALPPGSTVDYRQNGFFYRWHLDGDRVQVLYDPADPRGSARLRDFGGVWGNAAVFALFGAGFLAFGLLALIQGLTGRQLLVFRGLSGGRHG